MQRHFANSYHVAEIAGGPSYLDRKRDRDGIREFCDYMGTIVHGKRGDKRQRAVEEAAEPIRAEFINQAVRERAL